MEGLINRRDPLNDIVLLYSEISTWHDRDLNYIIQACEKANVNGSFTDIILGLKRLQGYFKRYGRASYSTNRARPYEKVTHDDIYLGNVFGITTKPVSYFRLQKDGLSEELKGYGISEKVDAYAIVEKQARKIIDTRANLLIDIINTLLSPFMLTSSITPQLKD